MIIVLKSLRSLAHTKVWHLELALAPSISSSSSSIVSLSGKQNVTVPLVFVVLLLTISSSWVQVWRISSLSKLGSGWRHHHRLFLYSYWSILCGSGWTQHPEAGRGSGCSLGYLCHHRQGERKLRWLVVPWYIRR